MPGSSPDTTAEAESTDTTAAVTEPVAATTDAAPADSSTAETTPKAEPSMLDAVKAAIAPKTEESPASQTPGDKADAEAPDSKTEADPDVHSPEELKALSVKTQRRIKNLNGRLDAALTENGALKGKADSYDKLNSYIRDTGITNTEANGALQLVAMLRSDPKGARERLMPIMAELDRIVGESDLPAALKQRVQAGYLAEEDARALVRADAAAKLNATRLEQTNIRNQEQSQQREMRTLTESTISSIETWETTKAKNDPDWHLKRAEVADQVELAIEREARKLGRPYFPNPTEAVKLSEDALKRINDRNKQFSPRPAEIRTVAGGASPRSQAAPKTMLDVVRQSVGA